MNKINRVLSFLLILAFLLTGAPSEFKIFAASESIDLTVEYNSAKNSYDISYILKAAPYVAPYEVEVKYHIPDESLSLVTETFQDENIRIVGTKVTVSIDADNFKSDHIYDISLDAYRQNGDTEPSHHGEIYYLAGMTFKGESFNEMTFNSYIDSNPTYVSEDGNVVIIKSGYDPMIKLTWKVPTIIVSGNKRILTDSEAMNALSKSSSISGVSFLINMIKGKGNRNKTQFVMNLTAQDYDEDGSYKIEVGENKAPVGFNAETNEMSVELTEAYGIEPGTEYESTNIGIIFNNNSGEVGLLQTKFRPNSGNHFPVENKDEALLGMSLNSTSIYTPIPFEITKIDTDKVEVSFSKIKYGTYPELFYQVQYVPTINDLTYTTGQWVKIPASSLPSGDYGYEIVNIDITGNENPNMFFRVVYYYNADDGTSHLPKSSSLAINLKDLGFESGRPPLPKEIEVTPIYGGREKVTVPRTHLSSGDFHIPITDLQISLEKPISWRQYFNDPSKNIHGWDDFKSYDGDPSYAFHIILSAYLPEHKVKDDTDTKLVQGFSDSNVTVYKEVYLPVKQKRVLVLSKEDFDQDPNDPNKLIALIPGDKLFYDYASDVELTEENNEDPSKDGTPGDYPTFLVPNTTYYMQMFTSRVEDLEDINTNVWGDVDKLESLNDKISYMSPIVSFTTWPLTEAIVPMPDIGNNLVPEIVPNPDTGEIELRIKAEFPRILTNADWLRYTDLDKKRMVMYEFFVSRNPADLDSKTTADKKYADIYNDEITKSTVSVTISDINNNTEPILPNTVYYVKARATLWVIYGDPDHETTDAADPVDERLGGSMFTAIKSVTTPKIDIDEVDDSERNPRAPSSFDIVKDENGEQRVGDIWAYLGWNHNEKDVVYEMVCTTVPIPANDPTGEEPIYVNDPYNQSFLNAYEDLWNPRDVSRLLFRINSPEVQALGLTIDQDNVMTMPIVEEFLRPNRIYYFSLRAVRNRGEENETVSRWITVPVTTKMVQPPALLKVVKDMQIGFNINVDPNVPGTTADSMEVSIRKKDAVTNSYVKLNRGNFTCVQDGKTFYFRIYNLEPNQGYDILVKNTRNKTWYDADTGLWKTVEETPIQEKTLNPLTEIEVRFEGEEFYNYLLEARKESDAKYEELTYSATGNTDYGYDYTTKRENFYKEKIKPFVDEGSSRFIYYARIRAISYRDDAGNLLAYEPLKANTLYYIKLFKRIIINNQEGGQQEADSLRKGPVTSRTDFSQADYDKDKNKDNTIDLFNETADKLTQKLYWRIDFKVGTSVRVILKDDRIAGLLQANKESTITVDISGEQADASYYEILVPYKTLEAIDTYNSRLNIKLAGAEITLNKGSIDLAKLKQHALTSGAKEAMLLLKVNRRNTPVTSLPSGFTAASKSYGLQAIAIGSRLSYAEIDQMIFNILKKPDTTGPFKYGILDRELTNVLNNLESYSYRNHVDLKDLISSVINKVEVELSRYLKDIIDGGSGLPADYVVIKGINEFPERIGVKIEYSFQNGFITPYVNYGAGWKDPAGGKGYVMQYVLFRAEKPGEYIIAVRGQAVTQPGTPNNSALSFLASRYDLSKAFGNGTIYTADPIKGEQAVMLYAVVTKRDSEITGMTPNQKVSKLGLGDIIKASELTGYMNNQASVSMAVKLYCTKINIDPKLMKPSKTITISNSSDIDSRLYPYVVLGVDLNLATLNNKKFDAIGRTTIGSMLDMVAKVLEGL